MLGVGLSFAFGSTPASVSFAEATLTAGGIGAKFGSYGWAAGFTLGVGYFGYQYFFGDKNKDGTFYLERASQNENSNENDPEDPKDKKNRKIPPPPPPLGNKNDKENNNATPTYKLPYIGYQTGGKRGSGGAERGHILVDYVSVNR